MTSNTDDKDSSIQLYAFPTSPYAMKVGCYLAYLQLDYQFVGVSPLTFRNVRFTGKRQVPVLKIRDEWKLDSQEIGFWLEEIYPGRFLLGSSDTEREKILKLDEWVSKQLIPSMFRVIVDWPSTSIGFRNGWKLASAVHRATPMPYWVRLMWPIFIRKANFIVAMMHALDRKVPLQQSQKLLVEDFVELLEGGPYLGGMQHPTLVDLSAFPIIVFPYRFNLQGDANWVESRPVMNWISAVQQHLPDNPFLVERGQLSRVLPI